MRLKIENKTQNKKKLKGTERGKQSKPKFIAPKAIMDPKTYESKLNLN